MLAPAVSNHCAVNILSADQLLLHGFTGSLERLLPHPLLPSEVGPILTTQLIHHDGATFIGICFPDQSGRPSTIHLYCRHHFPRRHYRRSSSYLINQ